MIIFPAIDILDGKCVRLRQGKFTQTTVYDDNPVSVAKRWEDEGAEYLHIVDLDGAVRKAPVNTAIIKEIVKAVNIPVQLGGGIRTLDNIKKIFDIGVSRVILGSAAVNDPKLIVQACNIFGEQIAVGIDAHNKIVKLDGWEKDGNLTAKSLAVRLTGLGVKRIIYTDIARDGLLTGVNINETVDIALTCGLKTIASGGVNNINNLIELNNAAEGKIEGVIIGKAIYTGAINLRQAIEAVRR